MIFDNVKKERFFFSFIYSIKQYLFFKKGNAQENLDEMIRDLFILTKCFEFEFSPKNATMLNLLREGFDTSLGTTGLKRLVFAVVCRRYPIHTSKCQIL